eukprot:5847339-Amphidinium_carterae.1
MTKESQADTRQLQRHRRGDDDHDSDFNPEVRMSHRQAKDYDRLRTRHLRARQGQWMIRSRRTLRSAEVRRETGALHHVETDYAEELGQRWLHQLS